MNRRIRKFESMLFGKPLLDLLVAAEPLRLGEALFELFDHLRRNRLLTRVRTWFSDLAEPPKASFFVELKPAGNRVAMDAETASRRASAFDLSGLQKKEHVVAALDLGVLLLADKFLQLFGRFGDLGKVVHGRQALF